MSKRSLLDDKDPNTNPPDNQSSKKDNESPTTKDKGKQASKGDKPTSPKRAKTTPPVADQTTDGWDSIPIDSEWGDPPSTAITSTAIACQSNYLMHLLFPTS